ncbi:MAG TPA: DEAD/DEAH box helicase [Candidatus Bathyarchaeota archaeon]|nr:DEAD/DEAH box helicase [Candidatus Bathyarchaeota archaeon]
MSSFDLLARPIKKLLDEVGFKEPTEPQEKAIPVILSGKNVLLIAPTGTGKTEAAILPVLHMYISKPRNDVGIKVLYITPLRALNRDMLGRLLWWCQKLDIRVMVRHGDTEPRERAIQAKHPPDLLITTPETLQAILAGKTISQHLKHVRWIIIDEVHELADNKRGAQLSIALQRLKKITIEKPQIIGLSATVGSPKEVGKFLIGVDDEIEILEVPCIRYMRFRVKYPKPTREDYRLAVKLYTLPEVAARLRAIKEIVEKAKSCLIFVNTRSIAEVLASRFKVWNIDIPISIHHGSLAKPSRILTEKKLKSGELKGVVCTSSLELGIDIGHVDIVIQYMSPREVTRLVQRVGRSGHRIGRIAKGIVITMDPDDTLEAIAICRRAKNGLLEPVKIPNKPLDVLCHQIAGLLVKKNRWKFEEIFEIVKRAYPYRNLTMDDLERVIEYMHNRYPRLAWASFEDKVVLRPRNLQTLYRYYFEHLSMIPDERQYLVIDDKTDTPLGILDEAFVAEYGEPGTKFIIRGSPWKIISIVGDRIYVAQVDDPTGAIPSWVGEEIPVPFEVAQEVGAIRREISERLSKGADLDEITSDLVKRYPISKDDLKRSIKR